MKNKKRSPPTEMNMMKIINHSEIIFTKNLILNLKAKVE